MLKYGISCLLISMTALPPSKITGRWPPFRSSWTGFISKAGAKKLRTQRQELTEQNESLRPKLGQIREELDQLSKLRYWTRKAIPEALPERDDFSEQMEVRENRRELERVMDAAIDAVTQETDEQQLVTESPAQEKKRDQERQ